MAYEYSDKGITVQCMCPGPVATDMIRDILKGEEKSVLADLMIPEVKSYTATAMKTLGFTYHTTGNKRHALLYQLGLMSTNLTLSNMSSKYNMLKQKSQKNNWLPWIKIEIVKQN